MGKDKGESVMRRSVVVVWLCLALTALSVAAAAPRPQGAGEDTAVAAESGTTAVHLEVEDERPLRVALLPLIDRTSGWLSRRMADELTERLEAELRLPLNDVMQWVVYVPEDEGEAARDEMLRAAGKRRSWRRSCRSWRKILGLILSFASRSVRVTSGDFLNGTAKWPSKPSRR